MITFSLVRDLLHERFPEARNKTSRACQRRINYIMKNPTTEDNVAIFLEEVRQDANIVEEFKASNIQRDMSIFLWDADDQKMLVWDMLACYYVVKVFSVYSALSCMW